LTRNVRATDIIMKQLAGSFTEKADYLVSLSNEEDSDDILQRRLKSVKTDLDAFSNDEICGLINLGFNRALSSKLSQLATKGAEVEPWRPTWLPPPSKHNRENIRDGLSIPLEILDLFFSFRDPLGSFFVSLSILFWVAPLVLLFKPNVNSACTSRDNITGECHICQFRADKVDNKVTFYDPVGGTLTYYCSGVPLGAHYNVSYSGSLQVHSDPKGELKSISALLGVFTNRYSFALSSGQPVLTEGGPGTARHDSIKGTTAPGQPSLPYAYEPVAIGQLVLIHGCNNEECWPSPDGVIRIVIDNERRKTLVEWLVDRFRRVLSKSGS
jgi:hypothetical protein